MSQMIFALQYFEIVFFFFYIYILIALRCFLQGSTEIDQLGKIFQAFGTPTQSQWSDMIYLPEYMEFSYTPAPPLRTIFPMASDDALDLLAKMFIYDPRQRITIQQALDHRFIYCLLKETHMTIISISSLISLFLFGQVFLVFSVTNWAREASDSGFERRRPRTKGLWAKQPTRKQPCRAITSWKNEESDGSGGIIPEGLRLW